MRNTRILKKLKTMAEEYPEITKEDYDDMSEEKSKNDFVQWSIIGDGSFAPSNKTLAILEPGLYEPSYNNNIRHGLN